MRRAAKTLRYGRAVIQTVHVPRSQPLLLAEVCRSSVQIFEFLHRLTPWDLIPAARFSPAPASRGGQAFPPGPAAAGPPALPRRPGEAARNFTQPQRCPCPGQLRAGGRGRRRAAPGGAPVQPPTFAEREGSGRPSRGRCPGRAGPRADKGLAGPHPHGRPEAAVPPPQEAAGRARHLPARPPAAPARDERTAPAPGQARPEARRPLLRPGRAPRDPRPGRRQLPGAASGSPPGRAAGSRARRPLLRTTRRSPPGYRRTRPRRGAPRRAGTAQPAPGRLQPPPRPPATSAMAAARLAPGRGRAPARLAAWLPD